MVQALGGVLQLVTSEDRLLGDAHAQERGDGQKHGDHERSTALGLEEACDLYPTQPQLDEEDGRHEQRAEDHSEEQVEPPSGTETEPELREGSPVEKASRKPHGQNGCRQTCYAADEGECWRAGCDPPAGTRGQPRDHDQGEDELDEHPMGPVLDTQPPQRPEPSCTPVEKQFQAASTCQHAPFGSFQPAQPFGLRLSACQLPSSGNSPRRVGAYTWGVLPSLG